MKPKKCSLCHNELMYEPFSEGDKNIVNGFKNFYDYYCVLCDMYFSSKWRDFKGRKSFYKSGKHGNYIRYQRKQCVGAVITPNNEQIKLEQELKDSYKSSIIPDVAFHDLFCKVMKEVTDKECECYGKDLPK